MPTPTPYQESSRKTLLVPTPTRPVAGRPVDSDSPTFDWTPVPGAAHYRVQIAETDSFDSIYYDEGTQRGTSLSLDSVLPDGTTTACWRVRAEAAEGPPSSWSTAAHFAVPSAEPAEDDRSLRVEAPPMPLQPTEDTPVDRSGVPFSWEEIPEASGYQLQVAPSETFADPAIDLTFDQTTAVTLCDLLPPDTSTFYWRIRALFRSAGPGPWSATVPFTVAAPPEGDEDLAPEAADTQSTARATGPVEHARTSGAFSLAVSLLAVLSFVATVLLIILLS